MEVPFIVLSGESFWRNLSVVLRCDGAYSALHHWGVGAQPSRSLRRDISPTHGRYPRVRASPRAAGFVLASTLGAPGTYPNVHHISGGLTEAFTSAIFVDCETLRSGFYER